MIENEIGFNPADGILYERTSGVTTLEHMLKGSSEILASNKSLPRKLKILEDARGAISIFSVSEFITLSERMFQILDNYDSIQHAVVHDNP